MHASWSVLRMCLIQSHFLKHHCITYDGICATHNQLYGEHRYIGPLEVSLTHSLSTSENMPGFALSELSLPLEILLHHSRQVECSLYSWYYDTKCNSVHKMELYLKHIMNITLIFIHVQNMESNNSSHVRYGLDSEWGSERYNKALYLTITSCIQVMTSSLKCHTWSQ